MLRAGCSGWPVNVNSVYYPTVYGVTMSYRGMSWMVTFSLSVMFVMLVIYVIVEILI